MKLTKSIMEHPQWGTIIVTRNQRARRIILRSRPDGIHITVPTFATKHDIEKALDECAPKLLQKRPEERRTIDPAFRIESDNFIFYIEEHTGKAFQLKYRGKEAVLFCPNDTDYHNMQEWLCKAVTTAIARRAKELLPLRLKELAQEKGFSYSRCSVRNVHTRWGSCNTKGNISLSIHLVLLPNELIDYVLLHELCHTVEMNHSERFWALMDKVVAPAKAKELRKMLKMHKTSLF
ncbi:MAG: M48 family metallopeptidase [Bacteroidaceae bacterium]|nr:M48 family metallopeptidase [Bacteroidaceae bacterium]